jgi:hypothetical protein
MTPEEIRAALEICRLGQREIANTWLDYDERTVRRWCAGDYPIPPDVAKWLSGLAAWHKANPPPKWRGKD